MYSFDAILESAPLRRPTINDIERLKKAVPLLPYHTLYVHGSLTTLPEGEANDMDLILVPNHEKYMLSYADIERHLKVLVMLGVQLDIMIDPCYKFPSELHKNDLDINHYPEEETEFYKLLSSTNEDRALKNWGELALFRYRLNDERRKHRLKIGKLLKSKKVKVYEKHSFSNVY